MDIFMHARNIFHTSNNELLTSNSQSLFGRRVFIGMSSGSEGVPIDVLTLLLAANPAQEALVLCTDAFQSMNGAGAVEVVSNRARFERTVKAMAGLFSLNISTRRTSEIIGSAEYIGIVANLTDQLHSTGLIEECVNIVPPRHRSNPRSLGYPVHQLGMCEYLRRNQGFEVKLGPRTEVSYDSILAKLGSPLKYAYAINALPVASKGEPRPVVHYVSGHRENGARLMCETPLDEAFKKIAQSSHDTLLYLYRVAREAGRCLWRQCNTRFNLCLNRRSSAGCTSNSCRKDPEAPSR